MSNLKHPLAVELRQRTNYGDSSNHPRVQATIKMSHPLAAERRLHYYRQLKANLEAHTTKSKNNSLRRQWLKRQKIANYQNEHDRIRNMIAANVVPEASIKALEKRKEWLMDTFKTKDTPPGIQD